MQSKLVENWLTNAKELSFTAPFVQLLIAEGFTVLQSKGGVNEQGKDVIAKSPEGKICCFQLKCGNIGSKEWQSINGQLNDLTGIAPTHPTITKTPKNWECFLVTNGDITGPVLKTILDYSKTNIDNNRMPLQAIAKDELLRRFSDAFGKFFPIEPNEIRVFFELFCEDGDNVLRKQDFKQYLERFLSKFNSIRSKQKKIEALQAVPVISSYILTNKYTKENHIALIDAWVLTLLTILYYANKWSLNENKYETTERLILEEIDRLSFCLINEVANNRDSFVDTTYGYFSEPILAHRLRCTELLGYISGAINYFALSNREVDNILKNLSEKISFLSSNRAMLSEGATPSYFNLLLLQPRIADTDQTIVTGLRQLVDNIIMTHLDSGSGLASPYYSTEQVVAHLFGAGDPIEEDFHNRSYVLWSAILLLVKYDQRDFLNDRWKYISEIAMEEIVAHDQNDLLLWRVNDAEMVDTFPNAEQSWSALRSQASKSYNEEIPSILLKRKYLVPLMILAMPHRLTPKLIMSLANFSAKSSKDISV